MSFSDSFLAGSKSCYACRLGGGKARGERPRQGIGKVTEANVPVSDGP